MCTHRTFLMVAGTVLAAPPLMSLVIIVIHFCFVASFGAVDMSDLQRIAGAGLMAIGLLLHPLCRQPRLDHWFYTLGAKNPGDEAVCGYWKRIRTVRHLKTFSTHCSGGN